MVGEGRGGTRAEGSTSDEREKHASVLSHDDVYHNHTRVFGRVHRRSRRIEPGPREEEFCSSSRCRLKLSIGARDRRPRRDECETDTMEALAQAISALPPDKIDRQQVLRCLGNAERNCRIKKHKEAAKWVIQVGAALHKTGAEALPIAERVFQHAVYLAKQLDDGSPDYMTVEFEANNVELGDAYTWLGATEAALGKLTEAETHYQSAAKAVADRSVYEFGDKQLHQAIFFRNRKMKDKYDATIKRWEAAIRAAGKADDREGDVPLLQSTCALLQEKAMGLCADGVDGVRQAVKIRGGRLAEATARLEAHPLRPKGSVPLSNVYDLTAATYDRLKNGATMIQYVRRSIAALAGSMHFAGMEPIGDMKRAKEGDAAVAWSEDLLGRWCGPGEGSPEEPESEDGKQKKRTGVPEHERAAFERLLTIGDEWKVQGGRPGLEPPFEGAEVIGKQLYALGTRLFAAEAWVECQRPFRTAAALFVHLPYQQGACLHYLACAYFHENIKAHQGDEKRLAQFSVGAFQASAAARLSLGPKHEKAVKEAIGSLLFLARVLVMHMGEARMAERVHVQALQIARDALGEDATETKQCAQSLMGLRAKLEEIRRKVMAQTQAARANGNGTPPKGADTPEGSE